LGYRDSGKEGEPRFQGTNGADEEAVLIDYGYNQENYSSPALSRHYRWRFVGIYYFDR